MEQLERELLKVLIRGKSVLDDVIQLRMSAAHKLQGTKDSKLQEMLQKNNTKIAYYQQLRETYQQRIKEIEDSNIVKRVAYG
jgi:hypothetical protein